MAKEVIDAVREAEQNGAAKVAAAEAEAERIVKEARETSAAEAKARIDSLTKQTNEAVKEAEAKAELVIEAAKKEAETEKSGLAAAVADKTQEAIDTVVSELLGT